MDAGSTRPCQRSRTQSQPLVPLTEINIGAIGYQILIGRDVLTLCNFHLDGLGLTFSLDY